MPGTDLTYAQAPLADRMNWARAISGAGTLVPAGFRDPNGQPNPAKILLAAEYGAMIGLHPMAALTGINVIEGKPSPSPALMSALVRTAGHKLRVTTKGSWDKGTYEATATLIRADDPQHPFEETWDKARATRAGLLPASSGKSAWARYPEAMCKWRAISAVCRDGAEDVLLGAHYVPEELGAEVNEAGEMIDVSSTVRDVTPPAAPKQEAQPAAGTTDTTRDHAAVAAQWVERIDATNTLTELFKLHEEAAQRGVLDHQDAEGMTVETQFLGRRTMLQDAARQADAGEPEPAIMLDGPEGVFDGEPVY